MSEPFPRHRLEDLAASVDYGVTASANASMVGPQFLRITDIQEDRVDWGTVPYCETSVAEEESARLEGGDIVFARTGATTGKSYLLRACPERAVFASYLIRVRPNRRAVEPRYLAWYFQTPDYWRQIASSASGTAQPGVNATKLKSLSVPKPPLAEQRRIADILDKADAIRRKRKQAIALAADLLQSAFLETFAELVREGCPMRTLAECCSHITDGAHLTPTYVPEGAPFLRVTDIQGPTILWNSVKRIPWSEHAELTRRSGAERGDVLYSKNGTIGIPRLVDWAEPFSFFVSLCLLKPHRDRLRGEFLESFLASHHALRQATAHTKTLTVSNLHLVEIRKMKLPLPGLPVQDAWTLRRRAIEHEVDILRGAAAEADGLFRCLLQRFFSERG